MTTSADVLVVDDHLGNRRVVEAQLAAMGHAARCAENGRQALALLAEQTPDLMILDIMIPEMDGHEVLERVKGSLQFRQIPVIVVSALDDMESIIRCVRTGADDYLTKPYNSTLFEARVGACLERTQWLKQEQEHQETIERYNLHLEDVVREKTQELETANRELAVLDEAKSDFLRAISHELRTPAAGLSGTVDLLLDPEDDLDEADRQELLESHQKSRERLMTLLDQALLLAELETSPDRYRLDSIPLRPLLLSAVQSVSAAVRSRQVLLSDVPAVSGMVRANTDLLAISFTSLLDAAIKFAEPSSSVEVSCRQAGSTVHFEIRAQGHGIPEDLLPQFFDVFAVAKAITPGGDLGLGPAVAQQVIRLFGAEVTVENLDPPGILLAVTLPLEEKAAGCDPFSTQP